MMGTVAGMAALWLAMLNTQSDEPVVDPVLEACVEAGGGNTACACVSRELHSRFNAAQITIIAAAMPDLERVGEPQSLVDELGFSLDQILNLRQRAMRADPVIRSACGRGISRD